MKESLKESLINIKKRYDEINASLSNPEITADINKLTQLNKELSDIREIAESWDSFQEHEKNIISLKQMLEDEEMKTLAEEELNAVEIKVKEIEAKIMIMLLPKDKDDERNSFLELRAGAGGDEAAIFVGDLKRMYIRFAERNNWGVEKIKEIESGPGGFKEVVLKVVGKNVYGNMRFESGVHRVQRVPLTESQGRIHTSTATVAVLPEIEDIEERDLDMGDIRVDTFRASGAGGQHVNKTDSAVRLTHIPSGIVVECQEDRSQHKNKAKALTLLSSKIYDIEKQQLEQKKAIERKSIVGTGDRSEKIRTYNFPQGRVTDHRIKFTTHNIDGFLDGEITDLLDSLKAQNNSEKLLEIDK